MLLGEINRNGVDSRYRRTREVCGGGKRSGNSDNRNSCPVTPLLLYSEARASALQTPGLDHHQVWRISFQCEHKDEVENTFRFVVSPGRVQRTPNVTDGQQSGQIAANESTNRCSDWSPIHTKWWRWRGDTLHFLYRDSNSLLEKVAKRCQGEEQPQGLYFNPSGLRQLQASPSKETVNWGAQIPAPAWFTWRLLCPLKKAAWH